MHPPDRNFPDPPINPNPDNSNNAIPATQFEAATSPANATNSAPISDDQPPNGLDAAGSSPQMPPLPSPTTPVAIVPFPTSGIFSHRIPRWRWAMSLLLIGFYPLFVSLFGRLRGLRTPEGPALPTSVGSLVLYLAFEMGIFAFFWGLGWAFSRATKDELLLRWHGGIKPILQGLGYAVALRLGLAVLLAFLVVIVIVLTGIDQKQLMEFIKQNQPQTDSLFSKSALANPLYLIVMMTLLSFVVAGLREELWRNASLAAIRHLLPDAWRDSARWVCSILLSSVVFGLGHIYQGGLGVGLTTLLGAGLGAVTWRHRSIWPAVFAHGFIDATSFLAAAAMAAKKIPIEAFFGR